MTAPASSKLLVLFVRAKDDAAKKKFAEATVTGVLNRRKVDVFATEEGTPARNYGDFGVVLKSAMDEIGVRDVLRREGLINYAQAREVEVDAPVRDTASITDRATPAEMRVAAE